MIFVTFVKAEASTCTKNDAASVAVSVCVAVGKKVQPKRAYASLWVSTVASGESYSSEVYAEDVEMGDNVEKT